ncbi:MAG: DNA-binding protein [Opitutaceae bacterium]|jgi:hypothetical protein|nr:DNA-binding protein [Opitutaceae bacterium]
MHTTEPVFGEACYHLGRLRPALQALFTMVNEGALICYPVINSMGARLAPLLAGYPHMDLGDTTLVALSERHPRAKPVTIDRRDFTVYRRKGGRPVPAIMPPVN